MNSPSNNSPRLVLRSLSIVTEIITRPCVAWCLILLLLICNGVIGWGMQRLFEARLESHSLRVKFDRQLLSSQNEILDRLEKVLGESGDCQ